MQERIQVASAAISISHDSHVTRTYNIRQCDMAVVENKQAAKSFRTLQMQLNRQTYPFQLISEKMEQINTPSKISESGPIK